MNRFRASIGLALLAVLAGAGEGLGAAPAAQRGTPRGKASKIDNAARCNINNLDFFVTNHGSLMWDLSTQEAGFVYPRGTTKTAVYAAGLWIGAKVNDSLRVTVGEYSQEFSPGPMVNGQAQQDDPRFRVYRLDRGDTTSTDYREWPVDHGAPVDSSGRPRLVGDVTLWCVYNDADPTVHTNRAGNSRPLGVEVQQTVFAFNQSNPLADCAFIKLLLINKGGNVLDSTFVCFWSDPDLGDASDDLVGCDTTRSLGYCYNATNGDAIYGSTPPAPGFDFFQGPVVEGRRLPMTSFSKYINATDPRTPQQSYNYMRGLNADGTPYEYPPGTPTSFQMTGDPVTGEGDVDSNPADRRLQLTAGPFRMAPGDSQEIVVGVIVGQGANRLSSIRVLQRNDDFAQAAYDLNFDIALPPPSPVVVARAYDEAVDLVWGSESEGSVSANARLGQEYHFEGYNVYQGASIGGPWRKIATFDESDSVGILYDDVFVPEIGAYERAVVQSGTNDGLDHHLRITTDAIRGGDLVNDREYYFAVTAYSYDVFHTEPFEVNGAVVGHVSEFPLETGVRPLRVTPAGSSAVLTENAAHLQGPADGQVVLEYLDPDIVEDKTYRVTFEEDSTGQLTWSVTETRPGDQVVISGQTKIDGDYTYPVVNGVMVRVIGPDTGAKRLFELCDDGREKNVLYTTGSGNCTGDWYVDPLGSHGLERFIRFDPPYNANHDYEIRFVADSTEYAWDFFNAPNGESGRFPGRVPWEVWDIGINTPNDTTDDVRITGMVLEQLETDVNAWSWQDGIYFRNIPYASVEWSNPDVNSITYDPTDEKIGYGRFFFYRVDGATTGPPPAPGTRIRFLTNKTLTVDDIYEFRTKPPGTSDGTVIGLRSQIYPIPNPYYNRSSYELNQFDRVLRFANLPPRKVTIRIFSLDGQLVRTIERLDPTQGTVDWNLLNDRGITVASGMYFWVAEVEGAGTQSGKMAVFVEKERLNTF